jgi:hypothetical protein
MRARNYSVCNTLENIWVGWRPVGWLVVRRSSLVVGRWR